MKTKLFICFVILLMLQLASGNLNAQTVQVTIPNTSAGQGESVSIPINISDVSGLNVLAYLATLSFDQQVLDVTGVTYSGTLTESWGAPTVNDGTGQVTVAGAGTSALTGTGSLIYINFDVVGAAGEQTEISFSQFYFNEGDPASNTTNGTFTVSGQAQAVNVTIPDSAASTGMEVKLPIRIGNVDGAGVISYLATLTFDQSVLDATGATSAASLTESWGAPTFNDGDGAVTLAGASTAALSDSGNLVYVTFQVTGNIGSETTISFSDFYFNEGEPSANTRDSRFIVSGWEVQNSGVSDRLYAVKAVSENMVWAVGRSGKVLLSTDSGENWTNTWTGVDTAVFYDVEALDENTAFIAGQIGGAVIYKTTNCGGSWDQVYELTDGWINGIKMFDQSNGIGLGDPYNGVWKIIKTTNGGDTWDQIANAPSSTAGVWGYPTAIYWADHLNGCFGTNSADYYQTADGGDNWSLKSIDFLQMTYSMAFDLSGNGIVAHYQGPMALTSDGGINWTQRGMPGEGVGRQMVEHHGFFWYLIENNIYISKNKGETWILKASALNALRGLDFVTPTSWTFGWAVGNQGIILKYVGTPTGIPVEENTTFSKNYQLFQNFPNPFNPTTTIEYYLAEPAKVKLCVYNIAGKAVKVLTDRIKQAGQYAEQWNGKDANGNKVASGIYLYRIEVKAESGNIPAMIDVKKMIMMK